jgi:aspartyl-tRNA synthetase
MKRSFISDAAKKAGETVKVAGWVHSRRDHGKLTFIDLRDRSGLLQVVLKADAVGEAVKDLRDEWVIELEGEIKERPDNLKNPNLSTGDVEMSATKLTVLNEAETPPFVLNDETQMADVSEENRMKYRYVDLRRPVMHHRVAKRSEALQYIRGAFTANGFNEVETPILTKSTPEGARDYLVPSRVEQGYFYALPQSPQQYKQLLMSSGVERYFQMARCFRDEDTRGDRQPEFTQLDMEMSFVTQEDVMALNEEILIGLVETVFPEKVIQDKPFPRLNYHQVVEKYGTDRPDLRNDKDNPNLLAFAWVVDFPFFEKTEEGSWTFTHNPFSAPKPEHMDNLLAKQNIPDIITSQYDVVLNGYEIGGGSIRNHRPEALRAVFQIMGFDDAQIEENFGHMLQAFASGTPPHGGIAWGFDRIMMLLLNQPNIREVITFPKTSDGRDLLMDAPSAVAAKQLREVGITLRKENGEGSKE